MDATTDEIIFNFQNKFQIYKSGRIERFTDEDIVPSSPDSDSGVRSKDVVISPQTGLSGRLFLPKITDSTAGKLSLLLYIHGGAFCIESPFSPTYHNYVAALTAKANIVVLSVHYRRATEHLLPIAYEDAWEALQWVIAHSKGDGPEEWLNYGPNDPMLNPGKDPKLGRLGCGKMLIFVAEKDSLRDRGWNYYKAVKESGWGSGSVEIVETEGEGHVFHLLDPDSDKALALMEKTVSFFKQIPQFIYVWVEIGNAPMYTCVNQNSELWLNHHVDFRRVYLAGDSSGTNIAHNVVARAGIAGISGLRIMGMVLFHPFFNNDGERHSGWGGSVEIVETEGEGHVFHLFDPDSYRTMALMEQTVSFLKQG
ncbi:hypothetical protein FNV43_RR22465 [Rhamnella rubrinervis]|uniref:Alpha/beta hydrolase fold-3 domain-containing protein n=1 Tax=Rhamnella rubrinervis TaxID=2594499 RepID=A0A8K0DVA1_9ROSA|nr:hypothetical protein FNV43_RR22465 [Rhamnella rubrinervis]